MMMLDIEVRSDFRIYPSRTVDSRRIHYMPGTKIEYMQKMFPDYGEMIKDDPNAKTIFDVLKRQKT